MFDLTYGNIDFDLLLHISILFVLLPMQILLCFKVKNRLIRLLPILILGILSIVLLYLTFTSTGWDGLGYLIFTIYSIYTLFICSLGWGIWWLMQPTKRKG